MNTLFKKAAAVDGTHLVGYVETTFDKLVRTFGQPHYGESGDGKTTAEWALEFLDGTIATIYDYKEPQTPLGNYDWHIGGRSDYAVIAVKMALNDKEKEPPAMSWSEIADLTHETQVSNFGFCICEDNDGNENPYEDCPKDGGACSCDGKNQVAQETAEYIAHIYFKKSDKIFNDLMEFIADGKFTGSYSRCADCAMANNDED